MTRSACSIDPARAEDILNARTAALAKGLDESASKPEDTLKGMIVLAAGQRYALPFHMLVALLPARTLHALPVRDDTVIGAIHERGEIWIVHSLAAMAGADGSEESAGRILLLAHGGPWAALRVAAVEGVADIERNTLTQLSADVPSAAGALVRFTTPSGLMVVDERALSNRLALPRRSHS